MLGVLHRHLTIAACRTIRLAAWSNTTIATGDWTSG